MSTRTAGLFSVSSIQLFVYLIAPLADVIKEEDLVSNIRLESGVRVWEALWQVFFLPPPRFQFRQPDVACFCTAVKQRRGELPVFAVARRPAQTTSPTLAQGIYVGASKEKRGK